MSHRQRLIEQGLLKPMSEEECRRRKEIINSKEVKSKPHYCIFRVNNWFEQIETNASHICLNPELIQDYLYGHEVWRICNYLSRYDLEQPKSNGNTLSLYRIADMEYFQEQTNKNAQLKLNEVETDE